MQKKLKKKREYQWKILQSMDTMISFVNILCVLLT